jgi:D-alanine-D-alanine ligase-like ATP-grasp enzyme
MQKDGIKIVGIVRGGSDENYKKSLHLGGQVFSCINENLSSQWKPIDILIDKEEVWHHRGLPTKLPELINKVDLLWNFAHPKYFSLLENLSIPNINFSVFSKIIIEDKNKLKEHIQNIDIQIPRHMIFSAYSKDLDGPKEKYILKKAQEVLNKFPAPWIVKTFIPESNTNIFLVKTFPELINTLRDVFNSNKSVLIEEFIPGKIIPVHLLSGFRSKDVYIFPLGRFLEKEKKEIEEKALRIFKHLQEKNYLRADFLLSSKNKIYLINLEFSPDLSENSYFLKACEDVGARASDVINHILEKNIN